MSEAQNPQAYPCLDFSEGIGLSMRDPGMTLRDYFAGQALPAVIKATSDGNHTSKHILSGAAQNAPQAFAMDAYEIADAMLAERTRTGDPS